MAGKRTAKMRLYVHIWGYNAHQCIDRASTLGEQLDAKSFEYSHWGRVSWNKPIDSKGDRNARCLEITAEGANADECIDRYNSQVDMLKSGCMDVTENTTVDWNHGDGGGP